MQVANCTFQLSIQIRCAACAPRVINGAAKQTYPATHRAPRTLAMDKAIRMAHHAGAREAGRRARRPGALPASRAGVGGAVHRCPPQRAEGAPAPGRWMGGEAPTAVRSAATCLCKPPKGGDGRRPAEPKGPTRSTACAEEPAKAGSRASRGGPPRGGSAAPLETRPTSRVVKATGRPAGGRPARQLGEPARPGRAAKPAQRCWSEGRSNHAVGAKFRTWITQRFSRPILSPGKLEDQQYAYRNDQSKSNCGSTRRTR